MLVADYKDYMGSLTAILVANIIPIIGVIVLGWNAGHVLLLYWTENLAIGFYTILKMALCRGKPKTGKVPPKLFIIPFFVFHFGIFTLVHGVFTAFLAGMLGADIIGSLIAMGLGFVSLMVSHGYSFMVNFIGSGERDKLTAGDIMLAPYSRVVVMHMTIIISSFFIMPAVGVIEVFGPQFGFLTVVPVLILIGFKTVVDGASHLFEHKKKASLGKP